MKEENERKIKRVLKMMEIQTTKQRLRIVQMLHDNITPYVPDTYVLVEKDSPLILGFDPYGSLRRVDKQHDQYRFSKQQADKLAWFWNSHDTWYLFQVEVISELEQQKREIQHLKQTLARQTNRFAS